MENYEIIQYIRKARRLTQKDLSHELNMTIPTISRVENGSAGFENTLEVCNKLQIDFSKDIFLVKDLDYFIIPENSLGTSLDFSLVFHLIQNFVCKVYIVESGVGFTQKLMRAFFNNCWIFIIIEIEDSFFIFHRNSKTAIIFPLYHFQNTFAGNHKEGSYLNSVTINSMDTIKSLQNHSMQKSDLKKILNHNIIAISYWKVPNK